MYYADGDPAFVFGFMFLHIVLAIGAACLAGRSNRSGGGWFLSTLIFGGVSFFFLLCCGKKER